MTGEPSLISSVNDLTRFMSGKRVVAVTGAGCSTPSGIGDYRDANGNWKRAAPVQHGDFITRESARKRYWLRSQLGWPEFAAAQPNDAHSGLARMEHSGLLLGIITQNVDGLHQRAGSRRVIDLHGRLDRVRCLGCEAITPRASVQEWLLQHNRLDHLHSTAAPDGDADVRINMTGPSRSRGIPGRPPAGGEPAAEPLEQLRTFRTPECVACGGVLKPDVVFYGDAVPRTTVAQAYEWVDDADVLLVVGSSLMVFSSFRFVRHAFKAGKRLLAVNLGRTRSDELFDLIVRRNCAEVFALFSS